MPHPFTRLAATALLLAIVAPSAAEAACSFGRCQNAVWAPGARTTSFGGISGNARLTPYGVTSGRQTAYGVTRGRQTAYGVSGGHQTSYGVLPDIRRLMGFRGTPNRVRRDQRSSDLLWRDGSFMSADRFRRRLFRHGLKRDVVAVGRLVNGLALYRYRYLWSDQLYVGVMAQEVAAIAPDAVRRGRLSACRLRAPRLASADLERMVRNPIGSQQQAFRTLTLRLRRPICPAQKRSHAT